MLHASLIALTLAGTPGDCDLRATIAGELMVLHQSGVAPRALSAAAGSTLLPDFAVMLVHRIVAAETSSESSARELAAYHFAAEIHEECRSPGLA